MTLWNGRFAKDTDALVLDFSQSISYDRRLYAFDIQGSQAHARMLAKQSIITQAEADAIVHGLDQVKAEIESGKFVFRKELEDFDANANAPEVSPRPMA